MVPKHVVFVAPYLMPTTMSFVRALCGVDDARVSLVTTAALAEVPVEVRGRLWRHYRVEAPTDPAQIVQAVDWIRRDGGTVDRLLATLEHLQVPVAVARDHLQIPGMGAASARLFRDKAAMKAALRAAGLPCARHCLATDPEAAQAFAAEVGYPLVIKPPDGAGAADTFRVGQADELEAALHARPPRPEAPLLLEEFVVGQEYSLEMVSIGGEPIWHSLTRYDPAPLHVLRTPWIQWCVLLPRELDDPVWLPAREAGVAALKTLGMQTGLSHMEWFRREDGSVAISEIGARPPGAQIMPLMSYAHDTDMIAAWARLMIHEQFDPPPRRYAAGAAFLRGQGQGRVIAIHGLEQAQKELGHLVVNASLPELGKAAAGGISSYEGEGWVLLRHPDTAEVERALRRLVSLVRVELG